MTRIGFLFVALFVLFTSRSTFSQETADAPAYRNGDKWIFRAIEKDARSKSSNELNGDYAVVYDGKFKLLASDGKTELHSGTDPLSVVFDHGGFGDGGKHLDFPLLVGKAWNYSRSHVTRGTRSPAIFTDEVRVVGIEDVQTEVGTFRAFKLVRDSSGPRGVRHLTTYFYSPDARCIVKFYQDQSVGIGSAKIDIALIKYLPGQ